MQNLRPLQVLTRGHLGVALLTLITCVLPAGLSGQEEVVPLIRGQVMVGGEPLPGAMVVLHEVSAASSGEIDSIQAGPDGTFSLLLPRVPDHGAASGVYFASVRFRGLLYFGQPLTAPSQLDSLYLIQTYDTLAVPQGGADLALIQRSIFLDKTDAGWDATDFFQVVQEGERTVYSPEDGVVWSYPLPPGATNFEIGQSDLTPDQYRFAEGRFEVYSPLPPGERFFLVRYSIPEDAFTVPMPGTTQKMEILVHEPGPQAEFTNLAPGMPVELEPGNVFRSYEGFDLRDTEIQGRPLGEPFQVPAEWLGLLIAALLGGVGVWGYRRGTLRPPAQAALPEMKSRGELLLAIARLDESFEALPEPSDSDRTHHQARREKLLEQLKNLS